VNGDVPLTFVTGEVLDRHVLDGDLLQEVGVLAAGVARDDALPPQPIAEPGQVTVTVEGVGQQVPKKPGGNGVNDYSEEDDLLFLLESITYLALFLTFFYDYFLERHELPHNSINPGFIEYISVFTF
jgi:hypothetical protein